MDKVYMDDDTFATMPGELELSLKKLKAFHPSIFSLLSRLKNDLKIKKKHVKKVEIIKEHIFFGDSQPAVVLLSNPLIIAAYSSDIDCIILLRFASKFSKGYSLVEGSRLLSVNTYGEAIHNDLIHGPDSSHTWNSFWPIIADFISDDIEKIQQKKSLIEEEIWNKIYYLGKKQLEEDFIRYRFGGPLHSCIPIRPSTNLLRKLKRT